MSWPFKNGRDNSEGCACHGKTFCPDYVCVGYDEQDVPMFMPKTDVDRIQKLREKNLPIDYSI